MCSFREIAACSLGISFLNFKVSDLVQVEVTLLFFTVLVVLFSFFLFCGMWSLKYTVEE